MVISLRQPSASFIYGLSEPHAAVYPKESIDAAGDGPLKEFIGTGPYRFVEQLAGRVESRSAMWLCRRTHWRRLI